MKENFFSIAPKNEKLKKHIAYYYFHYSNNLKFKKKFIYYPSYQTTLNIYKNVDVEIKDNGRVYIPNNNDNLSIIYSNGSFHSKYVELNGKFNKIGIVFNSIGINHFIRHNLDTIVTKPVVKFDYFNSPLNTVAKKIYATHNLKDQRDELDEFFIKHLIKFKDERFIKIIDSVHQRNGAISLNELSSIFNIHRKTILRLFKKHLGYSFRDYSHTIKFRNTLNNYQTYNANKLTELAYDNEYYDQASFNKHFKSLTNLTPKQLFSKLKKMGHDIHWNYIT